VHLLEITRCGMRRARCAHICDMQRDVATAASVHTVPRHAALHSNLVVSCRPCTWLILLPPCACVPRCANQVFDGTMGTTAGVMRGMGRQRDVLLFNFMGMCACTPEHMQLLNSVLMWLTHLSAVASLKQMLQHCPVP
jgi:hypothetical protein